MSQLHSPSVAAILSFVLPGLGQFALGAVRRGVLIAVPALAVIVAAVALGIEGGGAVMETLLRPEVLVGLLVLNIVLAGYHVAAIADAYRLAAGSRGGRPGSHRASAFVLALILVGTFSLHGVVEAVGYQAYTTLDSVFAPSETGSGWTVPEPGFGAEPSPTDAPVGGASPSASQGRAGGQSPTPSPSPKQSAAPGWAANGRLDLLLIGSDAGPDRWALRTDTMIVLSVDVESGRAALLGIPRNLVGVPLPRESAGAFPSGRFPGLLNALYVYAMGHAQHFPGGAARGFRAVSGAIQELVGLRIDGVVVVSLAGFVRLVDALGGLWIDAPERLVERSYPLEDGSGHMKLDIEAGCQQLDGRMALAYARSRHMDSDYGRMRRQQAVLVALGRQVDPIALLPKVPDLLAIAKDNLWTTVKRSDVRGLAELAARVDTKHVKTVLFVPSRYPSHLDRAEIAEIRRVSRSVFAGHAPAPSPSPGVAPAACP